MSNNKGKLIVIDGIDGTGKATQVELLAGRLKKQGVRVETIDFPRYYDNFFGQLIGECLAGKRGDFLAVDPRIASVLYAADRWETKSKIEDWLRRGRVVVADRYTSANQIHQGGKIKNVRDRADFLRWLDEMEHGVFGLPRPDLIIYLDLPASLSQQLLFRARRGGAVLAYKKRYAEGSGDAAEADTGHLDDARQSALKLVAAKNRWVKIDCAPAGELLSKGEVHLLVMAAVEQVLGLGAGRL